MTFELISSRLLPANWVRPRIDNDAVDCDMEADGDDNDFDEKLRETGRSCDPVGSDDDDDDGLTMLTL